MWIKRNLKYGTFYVKRDDGPVVQKSVYEGEDGRTRTTYKVGGSECFVRKDAPGLNIYFFYYTTSPKEKAMKESVNLNRGKTDYEKWHPRHKD